MWHGEIWVDHCAMEGLSAAGNNQGVPANALISILKFHRICHILKWIDDFCVFWTPIIENSPLPLKYAFDISSIHSIMEPLGIPWHPIEIKGQEFAMTVPYIGFVWDLANHLVSLTTKENDSNTSARLLTRSACPYMAPYNISPLSIRMATQLSHHSPPSSQSSPTSTHATTF